MRISLLAMVLGFLIDLAVGDPQQLYHPIRLVGNLIAFLDRVLFIGAEGEERTEKDAAQQFFWGIVLVVSVILVSTGIPFLILYLANLIHPLVRLVIETIMCWQLLATRSLKDESMKVYHALKSQNLEKSRYAVSMIVGRDTQELDAEGIARATVETIAENTSDGVVAPLFYMAIGGATLGWFYKCINTMDSMIGYKNDRYLYFGRNAAKLDDVVNFIPARLAGGLMVLGAYIGGFYGKQSLKIFLRDRKNHASPNSAQTEAAMAGALNVRLGGDAFYFGKRHRKKTIGDKNRTLRADDIVRANRLLYVTALLALLLLALLKGLALLLL
ncbi:MAG: adenosylcobinamide-phosphate synthase CbiB [Eubacteriales bacterium]|nr:adenosylcobinamide-phosphate synthase CbiB [Eubacteriales bacterium]